MAASPMLPGLGTNVTGSPRSIPSVSHSNALMVSVLIVARANKTGTE